jgi:hypothetical protein
VWLVTWHWGVGEDDKHTDKERVAAILNPRYSGERVRQFVELLYVNKVYTLSQRMDWAQRRKPYLARFGGVDGVVCDFQIFCGHNPHLFARQVDDFRIEIDANGEEKPTWTERASRDISLLRSKFGTLK